MTYAETRIIIDADSHIIELETFLAKAARQADLPLIRPMDEQTELPVMKPGLDRGKELYEKRLDDSEFMKKFSE